MITENVHVISLAARSDRRSRLKSQWPYKDIPLHVFDAIKAEPGSLGCLYSHMALLSQLTETSLILEDDAVFSPDFTLDLHPPEDWQVLWLGRQFYLPPEPVDDTWVRPRRAGHTHAYIIRIPQMAYDMIRGSDYTDIDSDLHRMPIPQYALKLATVGQGAGPSDIHDGYTTDMFWND